MKTKPVAILGVILSLVTIFILANRIENGDMNAVSMYLVVFLIPAIILALLNAFYVRFIDKFLKGTLKIIICFIPIAILKRWQAVMDKIKENYSPRRGSHPKGSATSQIPMSFTIDPKSSFIKSDRNESYKNGIDKVLSEQMHAYNFMGSGWDFYA